jgi:hypothetical protein
MGISGGPDIVQDGLVLELDAADKNSYPGSGTTWRDLSGNANNGTLTNGPTFNSGNAGSIVFDGVDDYVIGDTPVNVDLNNNVSVCVVFKFNAFTPINPRIMELRDSTYSIQILRDGEQTNSICTKNSKFQGGTTASYWFQPIVNTIYILNVVWIPSTSTTQLYRNGILMSENIFFNVGVGSQTNKLTLGVRGGFNSTTWLNGNIYNIQIYNRALSSTEILQNYNATKTRFGL